jgi:hypothetical protein
LVVVEMIPEHTNAPTWRVLLGRKGENENGCYLRIKRFFRHRAKYPTGRVGFTISSVGSVPYFAVGIVSFISFKLLTFPKGEPTGTNHHPNLKKEIHEA